MGNGYRILIKKPEGKRSLGRHRHKWEDNIKDVGCKSVNWIHLD
jgi:hypothetical protein